MKRQKGLTLLEILIVIAILGTMLAFIPRFKTNPKNNVKAVARRLMNNMKEARLAAKTKGATYRLAFSLGEGTDSYWIEAAPGSVLIKSEEKEKAASFDITDEEKKPASPFNKVSIPGLKDKVEIPSGLFILQVESIYRADAVKNGTAYIYISPEGMVEKSGIQIGDGKNIVWTLIFSTITGHADIVEEAMSIRDVGR